MNNRGVWIAFLLTCFGMTGLVGLFGTYAASIPLERALHRTATLDQAMLDGKLDAGLLRQVLGPAAPATLEPDPARQLARARQTIREEGVAESDSVARRTRLMIGLITVLAAALGAGILLLASRPARQ